MNKQDKIEHILVRHEQGFPFKISVTSEKNTKIDIIKFFLVIFFENKNVNVQVMMFFIIINGE